MKRITIILLAIILLGACTPKPEQVKPYVDQTLTSLPTRTLYPTNTAFPTYTKEPTLTPIIITKVVTATRTLTPTLTRTPTNTPTPVNSPTPTQPPTATFAPYQFTATAYKATQDYFAQFVIPDWKDFTSYPDKYEGQNIKITGRIFNLISDQQFQIWLSGTREAIFIISAEKFDNLYENDYVTIYGVGRGEHCGRNAFGGEVCQPLVLAKIILK